VKALPEPGTVVDGKYRIERVIGEGGMGRVFAAHHEVLDQRIALKFLFPEVAERPNVVERFLREAKAAAKLKSDHVARVMDAGTSEDGLPFLVMECLEGADLMELVKLNGAMPEDEVVDIMVQTLEAIAHAHAGGLVHRDLKPSNIFLAAMPDGTNVVKVLDFGIAKSIASRGEEVATLTGQNIMGSPAYMSPEQIRNARTVDVRSDIWSLGVVMFELVTGKLPFTFEGVGELLAAVLEQAPLPARARNPQVSEPIEKIISRALRRERDKRYQSAAEFARALAPHVSPKYVGLVDRIEQLLAGAPPPGPQRSISVASVPSFPAQGEHARPAAPPPSAEELTTGDVEVTTVEFPVEVVPASGRTGSPSRARRKSRQRAQLATFAAAAGALFVAGLVVAELRRPTLPGATPPPPPSARGGAASAVEDLVPSANAAAAPTPPADTAVDIELPDNDPPDAMPGRGLAPAPKGSIAKPSTARPSRPSSPPEGKGAPVRPKVLRSRE